MSRKEQNTISEKKLLPFKKIPIQNLDRFGEIKQWKEIGIDIRE